MIIVFLHSVIYLKEFILLCTCYFILFQLFIETTILNMYYMLYICFLQMIIVVLHSVIYLKEFILLCTTCYFILFRLYTETTILNLKMVIKLCKIVCVGISFSKAFQ